MNYFKDGYAICLNEWVLDKEIKNELNLLLIISSLCAKGYCYATNTYFSELFDISEETVSRKLKILEEKGYITIDYEKRGCEIISRIIRLTKISTDDYQKYQPTVDENVKEKNIINNNIKENNISNDILLKKSFKKPTLKEIEDYCKERNNDVRPERFYDHYESVGWKVGRSPMKDWKAAVRTWETKNKKNQQDDNRRNLVLLK